MIARILVLGRESRCGVVVEMAAVSAGRGTRGRYFCAAGDGPALRMGTTTSISTRTAVRTRRVEGFIADLQALIGIATPRSNTSLRPRVRFQNYPDQDVEKFGLPGSSIGLSVGACQSAHDRQVLPAGSFKADQQGGIFDPDDPGQPTDPGSTSNTVGEIRTRYQIAPELTFEVTERTRLGGSVEYQAVRFDSDDIEERDDYNYVGGAGFVSFALGPRSDLRFGDLRQPLRDYGRLDRN